MNPIRNYLESLGVLLVVAQLTVLVSAQECLQAVGDSGREISPPFRDDNVSPRLPSGTQAIITSYKFQCCGNITAWQTYVQPGGGGHRDGVYDITFQVWRPSPIVQENGCYSMVGNNAFTSVTFGSGGIVSETPAPSNILMVQPGDVVGYYTISKNGGNEGIQLETTDDNNYSGNLVWYHTNTDDDPLIDRGPNCPFPVGSEPVRVLSSSTEAAPVLRVSINTLSCPTSTIIASRTILKTTSLVLDNTPSPLPTQSTTTILKTTSLVLDNTPSPLPTQSTTTILKTASLVLDNTPSPLPTQTTTTNSVSSLSVHHVTTAPTTMSNLGSTSVQATTNAPTTSLDSRAAGLSTATSTRDREAGLSSIVIVGIAGGSVSALMLALLCTLVLAITIAKRKGDKNRMDNRHVNILPMKIQENEAYIATSHIPVDNNECYATTISTESNLAYGTNKQDEAEMDNYSYILNEATINTESKLAYGTNKQDEVQMDDEVYYILGDNNEATISTESNLAYGTVDKHNEVKKDNEANATTVDNNECYTNMESTTACRTVNKDEVEP